MQDHEELKDNNSVKADGNLKRFSMFRSQKVEQSHRFKTIGPYDFKNPEIVSIRSCRSVDKYSGKGGYVRVVPSPSGARLNIDASGSKLTQYSLWEISFRRQGASQGGLEELELMIRAHSAGHQGDGTDPEKPVFTSGFLRISQQSKQDAFGYGRESCLFKAVANEDETEGGWFVEVARPGLAGRKRYKLKSVKKDRTMFVDGSGVFPQLYPRLLLSTLDEYTQVSDEVENGKYFVFDVVRDVECRRYQQLSGLARKLASQQRSNNSED